jgi:ribonuclease T2
MMLAGMKPTGLALSLLFLVAIGCRTHTAPAADERVEPAAAQAGESGFDYYLLNLSWSPEFCYSHRSPAECAAHDTFVLHGLWPENDDGTYPENCSNAPGPANPAEYSDLYPDTGLLEHEWQTHGTCSGLSADAFFGLARTAYHKVKIPPNLKNLTTQTSMAPEEILGLFTESNPGIPRSSLVLSCGHNYLTAVEVCLDKGLRPVPCSGVRSCRANVVRIPAP